MAPLYTRDGDVRRPAWAEIDWKQSLFSRTFVMMAHGNRLFSRTESAAARAHGQWPTIGLFTGAGVGFALGVLFEYHVGWWMVSLFLVLGGFAGCLGGFLAALIVYRK
jgi:hypothetical protein